MPRYWRIVSNFHTVGEVIKIVTAPNWQGGMRKGVLAIKADSRLKGKKIVVASFTLQESSAEAALALWAAESRPEAQVIHQAIQQQAIQANEVPARPEDPGGER